jgi:Cu-processing system permease protein
VSDERIERPSAETERVADTRERTDLGSLLDLPDGLVAIASREYRLVVRSRWTAGVAVLFAVFSTALLAFGASDVGAGRFDVVAASLAELGVYLVPLVGLVFGYDAIVGAAESGTLELLFSLPVTQGRVVVGKYLGRATALGSALVFGFVPGAILTLVLAGLPSLGTYAVVVLAAVGTGLVFLAVGVLVSTVAREKTHALGGVLVAWLWFVLLHDLAALGAISTFDLSGTAVAAMVLTNPADCFRVLALSQLDTVAGGFGSILAEISLSVSLVAGGLIVWAVGAVGLATVLVRRRRL